eukprot:scaffold18104_cov114-Isochrysis_galbana.AAC.5
MKTTRSSGRDAPHLLFDLPHSLEVGAPVEGVAPQQQQLDQVLGQVPARNVEPLDLCREREPLVDRNDMGDPVARVDDYPCEQPLGVEREHRLDRAVHAGEVVRLEHGLHQRLAILLRVHRCLSQHDFVLRRVNLEAVEKGVVVQVGHVLPVLHDPVGDRVGSLQHVARRRALVANHDVLRRRSIGR